MKFLFNANATYLNFGLLFLRVMIGASFIYNHGYNKITHPEKWKDLGGSMSLLNIHFTPELWGFMAAFAEFFGASFLILGLFSRLVALMLAFTMLVAFLGGFADKEFNSYAFGMMIVFISLIIIGPGKFSLDAKIGGFKK